MKTVVCFLFVILAFAWFGCGDDSAGGGMDGSVDAGRPNCSDGVVDIIDGESCDDGNIANDDGCSANCDIEPGWGCPENGGSCVAAACGDGYRVGTEVCDDGNTTANDGCSPTCGLEWGYICPTPGSKCVKIQCGDGKVEGLEQCDDGNYNFGDGCAPSCLLEPNCSDGVCESACGDGFLSHEEECDDDNLENGDGCSASCEIETGFTCVSIRDEAPASVDLSVVYRDFRGNDLDPGHVDFENGNDGLEQGFVEDTLDASSGKPVYISGVTSTVLDENSFNQWYLSVEDVNMTEVDSMTLDHDTDNPGSYVFDDQQFFPLTGRGFNGLDASNPLYEATRTDGDDDQQNFHFTSEVRYWFEYEANEVLEFRGDDDVWVFVNNKLAVDIGGVHGAKTGSVDLSAGGLVQVEGMADVPVANLNLGLTVGGIYEVVVFQAERHTSRSSYKLTLHNFLPERSKCASTCGDGIKASDEECDDGNTAAGDGCDGSCKIEGIVIR